MTSQLFHRVLIPLDGSELALRVMDQFFSMPLPSNCSVTLIHVMQSEERSTEADAYLTEVRRSSGRHSVSVLVCQGDPAAEILRCSTQLGTTLLVMSAHGRSGVKRILLGSVTEEVVRQSCIPVLVWNPLSALAAKRPVLVPHDGTACADQIIPVVVDLATQWGLPVTLLHVLSGQSHPTRLSSRLDFPAQSAEETEARLGAQGLAYPLHVMESAGITVSRTTSSAPPVQAILAAAKECGLVAMATHGRTGFPRWAFGSVTESVLRACPCPLLTTRVQA